MIVALDSEAVNALAGPDSFEKRSQSALSPPPGDLCADRVVDLGG